MNKEEQDIEQLKSAKLASLNVQTQLNIDGALAEVDRLKTVALSISEDNKAKKALYEDQELALYDEMQGMKQNHAIAKDALADIRGVIEDAQNVANGAKVGIELLQAQEFSLGKAISTKKDELEIVISQKTTAIRNLDETLTKKSQELSKQEAVLIGITQSIEIEQARFDAVLVQKSAELYTVLENIKTHATKLNTVLDRVEAYDAELINLSDAKNRVEQDSTEAKKTLETTLKDIEDNRLLAQTAKKEMEIVSTELKVLIAQRLDSVTFMEQLQNREANLKKKYEDVGLPYPQ